MGLRVLVDIPPLVLVQLACAGSPSPTPAAVPPSPAPAATTSCADQLLDASRDDGSKRLQVLVKETYPRAVGAGVPVAQIATGLMGPALREAGLRAVLAVCFEGTPLTGRYDSLGECATGARIEGTYALRIGDATARGALVGVDEPAIGLTTQKGMPPPIVCKPDGVRFAPFPAAFTTTDLPAVVVTTLRAAIPAKAPAVELRLWVALLDSGWRPEPGFDGIRQLQAAGMPTDELAVAGRALVGRLNGSSTEQLASQLLSAIAGTEIVDGKGWYRWRLGRRAALYEPTPENATVTARDCPLTLDGKAPSTPSDNKCDKAAAELVWAGREAAERGALDEAYRCFWLAARVAAHGATSQDARRLAFETRARILDEAGRTRDAVDALGDYLKAERPDRPQTQAYLRSLEAKLQEPP